MYLRLHPTLEEDKNAQAAQALISQCVHCGFCLATCPTYQLVGDERDSPRGRIYLIKSLLETGEERATTRHHLDRCLTCRSCETTCPSGVEYGRLVDHGRLLIDRQSTRSRADRMVRWLLREGLSRPRLFGPAMRLGQALRPLMPRVLRAKVPKRTAPGALPREPRARQVVLLEGCVQPSMKPSINAATRRVLDAIGVSVMATPGSGCCGALRYHLDDERGALDDMRRNIDAWWPAIEAGAEAIISTASGCGASVADYADYLKDDPRYAERAQKVSTLFSDVGQFLYDNRALLANKIANDGDSLVWHCPCTLQHALAADRAVEALFTELGIALRRGDDHHLCCGSAGTYSVLQSGLATQLRDRKLSALAAEPTEQIVSANIGCITHLESAATVPVRHWIEIIDERLSHGL
ncbi:glycolate oxidase subunit GlcF [Gammaproteobacteria bacterium]|nr:glycolate oxidase subunit GlcF [Gammaproteobacteria bacterium]